VPEPVEIWVGKEEFGGVPTPTRRDAPRPSHWTLEAIAATERARSLSAAPTGDRVAFIQDRDTSDVWLLDIAKREVTRMTTRRELQPYWEDTAPALSPDGTQIAYGDEGAVWLVPAAGGPPRKLVEADSPVWLDDCTLVVTIERDDRYRLATVDLDDPWPRPLVRSSGDLDSRGDEGQAAVSPDRTAVAFSFHPRTDLNRTEIRVVSVETGRARALTGAPGVHDHEPAWAPDGSVIAFTAQRGEWYELRTVDPRTGEEGTLASEEADFSEPRWHRDGRSLVAVRSRDFRRELVSVDCESGAVSVLAPGGSWEMPVPLANGGLLASYEDQGTAPELRLFEAGEAGTSIRNGAPALVRAARHVRPEEVTFRSGDGLEIGALLFRPAGRDSGTRAVVYPHGGPTEFYGDQWDGHAQYFVDKGYAWLALNYRGSTGRGKTFERLNFNDWGGGDVQDCLAGADFLRSLDWVDSRRLAIFGASYGSYLALCSVTEDGGTRFRCGVCKYGDCDLLTTWAQGDRDGILYCGENMLGHPSANRDVWVRGSPVHRLSNLQVPLLIAHGERDRRVHPKQSEQLVAELKRLGKTFEYVTYPTEAHGLLRAGPQIDFYRRLERFLDWYLL
jgi:dipeptidyl aminopeptidase/acylaminoacyl peptidase